MKLLQKIIFFVAFLVCLQHTVAQRVSTTGKEFYISFYRNGGANTVVDTALQLYITSKVNTSGAVSNPNNGYTQAFNVNANTVTKVTIPAANCYNATPGLISNLGLIVRGLDTLAVSAMNTLSATSDATLVLQTNALGIEYSVMAYTGITGNPGFVSAFMVEATENQTQIEIRPSTLLNTGQTANIPFVITLNKGQTYFTTAVGDLSGTKIKVLNSCKKIAVFGGATGAQVPLGQVSADHLFEQMFPINSFGSKFLTPKLLGRNTARVKIVTPYSATTIKVDGVVAGTFNANQIYEYATNNAPQYIESSYPIQVCLFANGQQFDNANGPINQGDPSMMLIQPIEQQINETVFISPSVGNIVNHKFSVVCKTTDVSGMLLDGSSIASSFLPITGNLNYSAASLNFSSGQHRAENPNGFSGYVYGFGFAQGYSYSVGSFVEPISNHFTCNGFSSADTFTVKVCTGPVTFNVLAEEQDGTFAWDFGDGSPIVTTNGSVLQQIHTYAAQGLYIVTLTITSPCLTTPIVRQLKVRVLDQITPAVSIIASPSGTVCSGTPIVFRANATDAGTNPSYQWKLNGTNVGTNNPQYTASSLLNGDVIQCIVTSSLSCSNGATATATFTTNIVNAITPTVQIVANTNQICSCNPVLFTATTGSVYNSPTFAWKVNGINAGTNSSTFSYIPANNDVVTCTVTITDLCATANTANSNNITIQVFNIAPSPTIAIQIQQNNLCVGSVFNFTSLTTFGGNNPSFQWKINGVNVGTNSASFSTTSLNNNDIVSCVLLSNATCVNINSATSNTIVAAVLPLLQPTIAINTSLPSYCFGDTIKLSSITTNAGITPIYEWYVNNTAIPISNSASFNLVGLQNNDTVYCILISSLNCTSNPTLSNKIAIKVINPVIPTALLQANKQVLCSGDAVQLQLTLTNGSINPNYQWYWNNILINNSNNSFSTNAIKNSDSFYVIIQSNAYCVSNIKSNVLPFLVNDNPTVGFVNVDTVIKYGSSMVLNPLLQSSLPIISFTWQPFYQINNIGVRNPSVNPLQNTKYVITATNQAGCKGQGAIMVNVFRDLLMPNVFTPNNDGVNDVFKIPEVLQLKIDHFTIYNRWGQIIFNTNASNIGWNGLFKGAFAPTGNYIWIIKYYDALKKQFITQKGDVILVR